MSKESRRRVPAALRMSPQYLESSQFIGSVNSTSLAALVLHTATHGTGFLDRGGLAGEQGVNRVTQIMLGDLRLVPGVVVHGADVADLPLLVEDEEVRRGARTISAADRLALIVPVGVIELLVLHVRFNARQTVLIDVIDADGHELDRLVLVIIGEVDDPVVAGQHVGAMIGKEDEHDDIFLEVGQRETGLLATGGDSRNPREIGSLVADLHDLVKVVGKHGDGQRNDRQAEKNLPHRCSLHSRLGWCMREPVTNRPTQQTRFGTGELWYAQESNS